MFVRGFLWFLSEELLLARANIINKLIIPAIIKGMKLFKSGESEEFPDFEILSAAFELFEELEKFSDFEVLSEMGKLESAEFELFDELEEFPNFEVLSELGTLESVEFELFEELEKFPGFEVLEEFAEDEEEDEGEELRGAGDPGTKCSVEDSVFPSLISPRSF